PEENTSIVEEVVAAVTDGNEQVKEEAILRDRKVSAIVKHVNMVGNYIVALRGQDAVPWIDKARKAGVKEEDLADLGYICILTAGIPTWFEISDSLKLKNDAIGGEQHG